MKIYKISAEYIAENGLKYFYDDEDDTPNMENLKSISDLKNLSQKFTEKAQKIYDDWDEEDIETYAGGGICHLIAEEMSSIMWDHGIQSTTYSSDFEQHVYCIALVKEGIYAVDIHHSYYETGGGFSWNKIEDVEFQPEYVSFYEITSDISQWDEITGEY